MNNLGKLSKNGQFYVPTLKKKKKKKKYSCEKRHIRYVGLKYLLIRISVDILFFKAI